MKPLQGMTLGAIIRFLSAGFMISALISIGIFNRAQASHSTVVQVNSDKGTSESKISNSDGSVTLTKLNDELWVHTTTMNINGNEVPANGLLVNTSQGLILIDATWNDQLAEELLTLIHDHFHKRVKKAIITHHKIDRIGGIGTLLKHKIPVESTALIAHMAKEAGYPVPDPALDDHPLMKYGKTIIEAYYPGEAHTKDNITIWFPQYKILFGDMIFSLEQQNVGIIDEATMDAWPFTIQNLINKYPDAQIVIPGHKSWGDFSLLSHTKENLHNYQMSQ
ncbi:subclass B1 metallo-beta-lactamase [Paenibacillus hexagrammi]|uniref:beta-lactamase n=1 Tax=Paenibacillus hexagrammi TaxID=2908839 RepID=A0ABY3SHE5_9BACL|nr:subclass B1 metallo-beta-lactamase [Paenibacillus sp. YPD9-1]UJF32611.1 subclass B1 metallo-beta-lactamase [Paenibacillus sp. YPD9-1]